jgi:hypothetical protein
MCLRDLRGTTKNVGQGSRWPFRGRCSLGQVLFFASCSLCHFLAVILICLVFLCFYAGQLMNPGSIPGSFKRFFSSQCLDRLRGALRLNLHGIMSLRAVILRLLSAEPEVCSSVCVMYITCCHIAGTGPLFTDGHLTRRRAH